MKRIACVVAVCALMLLIMTPPASACYPALGLGFGVTAGPAYGYVDPGLAMYGVGGLGGCATGPIGVPLPALSYGYGGTGFGYSRFGVGYGGLGIGVQGRRTAVIVNPLGGGVEVFGRRGTVIIR